MDLDDATDVYQDVQRALLRFQQFQDQREIPRSTQFGFIKAVFDNGPFDL